MKLVLTGGIWISAGSIVRAYFTLPARKKLRIRVAIASDGHYGQPETDYMAMHTGNGLIDK